jgi:pheromone shutdown protein TraB
MKVFWELMKLVAPPEEEDLKFDVEELMKEDAISMMMKELKGFAPTVAEVLITERDEYISKKILEGTKKGKVLAVVGAGHLEGIKKNIEKVRKGKRKLRSYEDLEKIPRRAFRWSFAVTGLFIGLLVGNFLGQILYPMYLEGMGLGSFHMWHPAYKEVVLVRMAIFIFCMMGLLLGFIGAGLTGMKGLGYSIPFLFVFLLIFLALNNKWDDVQDVLIKWILINGFCALIGAIIAWGHPASWAAAFFAAPWTSLNPAMAAGWVAGAVELVVRKPKNEDLLDLFSGTFETMRDFLRNKVFKVIAVTALVNLGSIVGTIIAGWWIAANICL